MCATSAQLFERARAKAASEGKSTCPNCGYCEACGRSYRSAPYYVPYWPTWPQPIWYGGYQTSPTVVGTTSTNVLPNGTSITFTC